MGKLTKKKPLDKSTQKGDGQTSMLNFFSKIPAGQSKLFNQLPQPKPKPMQVNKLSKSTNKKTSTRNLDVRTIPSMEDGRHSGGNIIGSKSPHACGQDKAIEEDEINVIVIPETPESTTTSTPSSSSGLLGRSPQLSLNYNISDTPTSSESNYKPRMASKPIQKSINKHNLSNFNEKFQFSPSCVNDGLLKQSNFPHSQEVLNVSGQISNSGHSLLKDIEMEYDSNDEFTSIPETQFTLIPDAHFASIPETQFPSTPETKVENLASCTDSKDTRKSLSKFDNISYQKTLSNTKVQSGTTVDNNKLDLDVSGGNKRRNMSYSLQNEMGKSGKESASPSVRKRVVDDRKILIPKRIGNKLSRTHRKLGMGLGKSQQSKPNQEKAVCLDQTDLDLLQDCLTKNTVMTVPKVEKINKNKLKSHKISSSQHSKMKKMTGFDDLDCSILEELLENVPEDKEGNVSSKLGSSAFEPSKINLKGHNQSGPSHLLKTKKVSHIKLGSQKRSPCRGNSPFAKRVSSQSVLAKPGSHVKSLFQDEERTKRNYNVDTVEQSKIKPEEILSLEDEMEDAAVKAPQLFTEVRKLNLTEQSSHIEDIGRSLDKQDMYETDLCSVAELLQKTPNRLKCSPLKPHNCAAVSPGTDALWDNLDDSFMLAAADMDALAEMEADTMTQQSQPKGASVDSQLSHDLNLMSPFKNHGSAQPKVKLPADLNRYIVTAVVNEDWQKTVHLNDLSDHSTKSCILQATWFETPVHEGSIVAIHGSFNDQGVCVINQQQNFIIVNPDLLLTGTNVTKSIRCLRSSVLGEKFKGMDIASKPMLLGTTLHEVFDEALAKKCFSADFLQRVLQKTLKKSAFLSDMYSLGLTEKQLLADAEEYMSTMKHWADRYLQDKPKSSATMEIKFPGQMRAEKCNVCVSGVKDIEETVWSPRWGLKGKVDVTAQVKIHRSQPRNQQKTYTVPLELKTGRQTNSIEHRSQVILYSVMLGDLDDNAANDLGVLLYVKTGEMLAVPAMQMDKRELLHLRNQLAYSLSLPADKNSDDKWIAPSLPEPIQDEFTCSRCTYLTSCSMLASLDSSASSNAEVPMPGFFTEQLAHLNPAHKAYFSHWYLLCILEHMAGEKRNTTKQIWCKDSWEREQKGDCISGLVLGSCHHHQQRDCHLITFRRKPNHKSSAPINSLPFSSSDRVVVGLEGTRIVTCFVGFIETLSPDQVTINSERSLKFQLNGSYRVDKADGYNSMASSLVNLARLMEPQQSRLREIVVDFQKPEFDSVPSIPNSEKNIVEKILSSLNSDQQYAIKRVLSSQQYTLIVGMPGTGKTTTIVGLVRILHAYGLSVLVTSYTHSAVDNILLKLCKYGIDFLRLGSKHRIHPDLHKYTEDKMYCHVGSVQQLGSVLETKPVVATTCLGAKHKLLSRRIFDVCIVDEASQIGQLVCLGPLYVANRFVLVGDHQQLPPLVQSPAARKLGMDESLFQRLALHHPESTVQLSLQYRMNSTIMQVSNTLVYGGRLQCGNNSIATATLHIPRWSLLQQLNFLGSLITSNGGCSMELRRCIAMAKSYGRPMVGLSKIWADRGITKNLTDRWLHQVLDPANVVTFLNMDKVEKHDSDDTAKPTVNHTEGEVVLTLIKELIKGGCKASSIGVIAPYRMQCKLLTGLIEELQTSKQQQQSIEVNTVDKYQGRDKEVIIVSFTHSQRGMDSHSGLLLEDMRRLNVAVTRAKHKLILLGSVKALTQLQTMQKLLDCLANSNAISDMPPDAIRSTGR